MCSSPNRPCAYTRLAVASLCVAVGWACIAADPDKEAARPDLERTSPAPAPAADVIAIETTSVGAPSDQRFRFAVTVRSDEVGCERYADWWEILQLDGKLLQRRILTHSHVDEQPFTRSGPALAIAPDLEVLVRAHLHPAGYVGQGLQGSIEGGWRPVASDSLATELADAAPLPDGCRF